MQMPNASPQGIAGLMQKPPGQMLGQQQPPGQAGGQPPMPSPNKASPMAGLGSVDDRVSAYAGNSKPLQQRYAMSQDLLDLLALQKIKSQKDAAARQMQLDMARQQDANGESSMTVAQQREKEVTDLTTNELAEQRGDTAGQQNRDQQQKMQAMLRGGLPTAPGAGMAAQPVAMAAGGIVGYAGPQGSVVGEALRLSAEQIQKLYEVDPKLAAQARRGTLTRELLMRAAPAGVVSAILGGGAVLSEKAASTLANASPEQREDFYKNPMVGALGGDTAIAAAALNAGEGRIKPSTMSYSDQMKNVGKSLLNVPVAIGKTLIGAPGYGLSALQDEEPPKKPAAAAPAAPAVPPPPDVAAAAAAPVVRPPQPAQPAAVRPPQPAAPPAGLGSLPAAGAEGAPAGTFGQRLEAAALKNAEMSSAGEGLKEEERVAAKLALTPEERQVHTEGIAGLKQMYDQQYDPERQRQEGLTRALIGAGGRAYGELGAAAGAGLDYDAQQRAAKLKEFGGIQSARTGLIDLDRGARKEGITAGQNRSKDVASQVVSGLSSGANLYSTDVNDRAKTLDRAIEKMKAEAAIEANRINKENLGMDRARAFLGLQQTKLENTIKDLDRAFQAGPNAMLLMQDPAKLKPEDKNRLDIALAEHEKNKARIRTEMKPVLDSAMQKLGLATGNDTASPAQEAALAKYAPKVK